MLDFSRINHHKIHEACDGKNVTMELFLAVSYAQFCDQAQKHNWCLAAELDERFFSYLAQGAFNSPLYDDLLNYCAPGKHISRTDARYTFTYEWYNRGGTPARTFGPSKLPRTVRQMLALVENSRRGIVTELPIGIASWWPTAARIQNKELPLLLTAATPAKVDRLWREPFELNDPYRRMFEPSDSIGMDVPLTVIYNGSYHLLTLEALHDAVEQRSYSFAEDPKPLRDLLDKTLTHRRLPTGLVHPTLPACPTERGLQFKNLTLQNRMAPLPVEPDDCSLFRQKYPALLLLRQSPDGQWTAEEDCPWRMPTFDEMLQAFYNECKGKKRKGRTYGLAVDMSIPLTRPEDVLLGTIYGFAFDEAAKTIELTDGTAALQSFRDALNLYIEFMNTKGRNTP